MANKSLFKSLVGKLMPRANTRNEAGGKAYKREPRFALAQYAATGCLNGTFYADAETQLDEVLEICVKVEPEFVAKTAIFAREQGFMKDMPALLLATLAKRDVKLFARAFGRVVNSGKMLRNVVQVLRSGVTGRKSLGTAPKREIKRWLEGRSDAQLFADSVGNDPSLADVIKMVHPRPGSKSREALFGYLLGRKFDEAALPKIVRDFESFKAGESETLPDVPFAMLTSLKLSRKQWCELALKGGWHNLRMNLNTYARHGVFDEPGMAGRVAERLADPEAVKGARVFPYQLLVACFSTGREVPELVREALQDALELSLANVPQFSGRTVICLDVSGSMHTPVTGKRKGATTTVRCIDVAALFAAAILRKNLVAEVIAFNDAVVDCRLNPRDSVMTNAKLLSSLPQGGTNCSAPLAKLNAAKAKADLVVYVSDNQSWVDEAQGRGTATMEQWAKFEARNPGAKLACIDVQPSGTTQAAEREDVLNIGGFGDSVFELLELYAKNELSPEHWVGVIEKVKV